MTTMLYPPLTFFREEFPAVATFLGFPPYPLQGLDLPTVEEFKRRVEAHWEAALDNFQRARNAWAKAYNALALLEASKNPNSKAIAAKAAELSPLRATYESTYALMLAARRLEEVTRALPGVFSGRREAIHAFIVLSERVEAYTPGFPQVASLPQLRELLATS